MKAYRNEIVLSSLRLLCVSSAGQGAQAAVTSSRANICDRGVEIPAVYINTRRPARPAIAVTIYVEGG